MLAPDQTHVGASSRCVSAGMPPSYVSVDASFRYTRHLGASSRHVTLSACLAHHRISYMHETPAQDATRMGCWGTSPAPFHSMHASSSLRCCCYCCCVPAATTGVFHALPIMIPQEEYKTKPIHTTKFCARQTRVMQLIASF